MIDKHPSLVLYNISNNIYIFDKIHPLLFVISTPYNDREQAVKGTLLMKTTEKTPPWGCVVLAAGLGKRFDGDKLHAEFRGQPLYERAFAAVPESASAVAVVSGDAEILAAAEARGYRSVRNDEPEKGVSRSIALGLDALEREGCRAALFLVADQPLLRKETVQRVVDAGLSSPGSLAAPKRANGELGNPCFFPAEYFDELRSLHGDRGGRRVISAHSEALVTVAADDAELEDTDNREELIRLKEADAGHTII